MNKYLFAFSIGPVQNFISQSRKTQDLYASSRILSDLIDYAINNLPTSSELIFPSKTNIDSKPNRFIAIIDCNIPDEFGRNIENMIRSLFVTKGIELLQGRKNDANDITECKNQRENAQLENALAINWTIIPYKGYKISYPEIELKLGAIKSIRKFDQMEETGVKCSVCGERNALYKGEEHERLCAVCYLKRKYCRMNFYSLAHISLLNLINCLENDTYGSKLLDNFKKLFINNYFDEEYIFEENLSDKYLDRYLQNRKLFCDIKARQLQNDIMIFADKNHIKISRYYGVITMDGDSMGKWLSGVDIDEKEITLKEFHKELSLRLGEFADSAKEYLDSFGFGKTVYAGGEDFLGFVNIQYLFSQLIVLRNKFEELVNSKIKRYLKDKTKNITISAGITIAHYKAPLPVSLRWCRNMEEEAKSIDEHKNAFALSVLKHSGEISKSIYNWDDGTSSIIEVIQSIIEDLSKENFSCNFIDLLQKEFRLLINEKNSNEIIKLAKLEIGRLVERSCMLEKDKNENEREYKQRKKLIITNMTYNITFLYEKNRLDYNNFTSLLRIIEFIKREAYYV